MSEENDWCILVYLKHSLQLKCENIYNVISNHADSIEHSWLCVCSNKYLSAIFYCTCYSTANKAVLDV